VKTAETSSTQHEVPLEAKVNGHKNIDLEGMLILSLVMGYQTTLFGEVNSILLEGAGYQTTHY
jgi:hypothetical protein